jgi:hypothetical protein
MLLLSSFTFFSITKLTLDFDLQRENEKTTFSKRTESFCEGIKG